MTDAAKTVLEYFFESNRIPVWIFSEGDDGPALYFTTARQGGIRPEPRLMQFFDYFLQNADAEPTIHVVSTVELYAAFSCGGGTGRLFTLVAGPAFNFHPAQSGYAKHLSLDYLYDKQSVKLRTLDTPVVGTDEFGRFAGALFALLTGRTCDPGLFRTSCLKNVALESLIDKELTRAIFDIREEAQLSVYSYEREQIALSAIRRGDVKSITDGTILFSESPAKAAIALKTKHQFEYEVVSLVAIITRAAVEGGLDVDTAFSLSDLYLNRIDNHKTPRELIEIARHAMRTFAEKVREQSDQTLGDYPPRIKECVKYIRAHLHYPITLDEVADNAGLSPKYFSRYFLSGTGMRFTDFVREERIREACELLKNTEMSSVDIGNSLSFSSQSYFIKTFSDAMGMTPQKYRERARAEKRSGKRV